MEPLKVARCGKRVPPILLPPDAAMLRSHRSSRVPFPPYSSSSFSLHNNCNFSIPPFRILVFSRCMRRIDTNTGGTPKIGRKADDGLGRSKPAMSRCLSDSWMRKKILMSVVHLSTSLYLFISVNFWISKCLISFLESGNVRAESTKETLKKSETINSHQSNGWT